MNLHYKKDGPVARIVLDNPPVNVFTPALHKRFYEILTDFIADDSVHVAVWTAAGDRAFCAGDDIKSPRIERSAAETVQRVLGVRHDDESLEYPGWERDVIELVRYKPIIAAVDGHCLGQGFIYLMLLGDLRIATTRAKFGLPEIKYGMGGAGGMMQLARQLPPSAAMWMVLTGESYNAEAALRHHIVNEIVAPEQLEARAMEIAERVASHPPLAVRTEMEACYRTSEMSKADAIAFTSHLYRLQRLAMDPTPPLANPSRKGSSNTERRITVWVAKPATRPMPNAANNFVMVNGKPKIGIIRKNICGSISGDASQKAITGASGTPAPRSPAMIGTTPQEQNGDTAPKTAASTTERRGFPANAIAICWSRPVAFATAATSTEIIRNGKIPHRAAPVKTKLSLACCGTRSANPASNAIVTNTTRSIFPTRRAIELGSESKGITGSTRTFIPE